MRKPDAFDINVHHRVEVGFGVIDKRGLHVAFDAGIVEGDMKSAVRSPNPALTMPTIRSAPRTVVR